MEATPSLRSTTQELAWMLCKSRRSVKRTLISARVVLAERGAGELYEYANGKATMFITLNRQILLPVVHGVCLSERAFPEYDPRNPADKPSQYGALAQVPRGQEPARV